MLTACSIMENRIAEYHESGSRKTCPPIEIPVCRNGCSCLTIDGFFKQELGIDTEVG